MSSVNVDGNTFQILDHSLSDLQKGINRLPHTACVYILITSSPNVSITYVGETQDLHDRFENHHKLDCAIRYGATAIAIYPSISLYDRRHIENHIKNKYNPICND